MKFYSILILIFLSISVFGQNSDIGNWINYFGNKKINSSLNWHHEAQYRNYNAVGDLEQLLLRTGIGYNLTENNNNLLLGYGFILSQNYIDTLAEKININEHRVYQQFITKQKAGKVSLQHRYRFEQRWVEDQDIKFRVRYFLGLNVPLNNPTITDKTFFLSAYNEIFLNTKNVVFDRNRLYGALGYKLNNNLKFELGYMNQFFNIGGRDQFNLNTYINF